MSVLCTSVQFYINFCLLFLEGRSRARASYATTTAVPSAARGPRSPLASRQSVSLSQRVSRHLFVGSCATCSGDRSLLPLAPTRLIISIVAERKKNAHQRVVSVLQQTAAEIILIFMSLVHYVSGRHRQIASRPRRFDLMRYTHTDGVR